MRPTYRADQGDKVITTYNAATRSSSSYTTRANAYSRTVQCPTIIHKGNFLDPLPHSYTISEIWSENGFRKEELPDGSYTLQQGFLGGASPNAAKGDATQAINEALDRAYGKIFGDLNLSVDVAEFPSTARMFNACDQAEKLFGGKARLLRRAGSAWLQYVYGWRPLASTIYNAVDESQKRLANEFRFVKARASSSESVEQFSGNRSSEWAVVNSTREVKVEVGCTYFPMQIPSISRWTSLNPALIAWELVPFSFVVDWFYDVGGYMQSFERALLTKRSFRTGYLSVLHVTNALRIGQSDYKIAGRRYSYYGRSSSRLVSFNRSVLAAPPLPRPPVLQTSLSSSRLFNAAALLSQLLK